jgi:hypothetical protein
VEDDAVTFSKQAMRYRGPDVAHATHEYQHKGGSYQRARIIWTPAITM